jgi:hypothetical protein
MHDVTARVHDERARSEQRFNLLEKEGPRLALSDQARRRRVENEHSVCDFGCQRRDTGAARGAPGSSERIACRLGPQASDCDTRNGELMGRPERGREGLRVKPEERALGFLEPADQQEAPDRKTPSMRSVDPVAVRFKGPARGIEGFRGPAELARDERDLGFRDHAPRPGEGLSRAKGARRGSHQGLRPRKITELRHRDTAQRERGRILAQRNPLERAQRITCREGTRRGRD